jgi:DNA-directed RNA polymerase specialized sigma24 family protein
MTRLSSDAPSHAEGTPEHRLSAWVRQWNKLRSPRNSERAPPLTAEQQQHLEELYPLIVDDLRRLAASKQHRWLGDSSQDRVHILFTCLVQALDRSHQPIDPEGNITALLMSIAGMRAVDLFRRERRHSSRRAALKDDHEASGGTGIEEATATRDYEAAVLKATWAFWDTLPSVEREIMRLRHEAGGKHPRTFASIAAHLGPYYKPNTVQVSYNRTLERTREHLRRLGLLDEEGAD